MRRRSLIGSLLTALLAGSLASADAIADPSLSVGVHPSSIVTTAVADASSPALQPAAGGVEFDLSPFLDDVGPASTRLADAFPLRLTPVTLPPIQSELATVPLPPAILGVAALGAGWIAVRGARVARRHFRARAG
jgi:hypothetical protein